MKIKGDVEVRDLLPLGSVVTLKGSNTHRVMITEYFVKKSAFNIIVDKTSGETCDTFDYMGIDWYETRENPRESILFNHENINEVLFHGYVNEESIAIKKMIEEKVKGGN